MPEQRPSQYVIPARRHNKTVNGNGEGRHGEGISREPVLPSPVTRCPPGPYTSPYQHFFAHRSEPEPIIPPTDPFHPHHRQQQLLQQQRLQQLQQLLHLRELHESRLQQQLQQPHQPQQPQQPQQPHQPHQPHQPQNGSSNSYTNDPTAPQFCHLLPPSQQQQEKEEEEEEEEIEEEEKEEPEHLSIASLDSYPEGEDLATRSIRRLANSGKFGAVGQVRISGGKWGPRT